LPGKKFIYCSSDPDLFFCQFAALDSVFIRLEASEHLPVYVSLTDQHGIVRVRRLFVKVYAELGRQTLVY